MILTYSCSNFLHISSVNVFLDMMNIDMQTGIMTSTILSHRAWIKNTIVVHITIQRRRTEIIFALIEIAR